MKKTVAVLLTVLLLLALVPMPATAAATTYTLPVFETSDIHGYLVDTAYDDPADYQYRLAYIAGTVEKARNGDTSRTLLLDGGDIYQGNVISNLQYGWPLSAAFAAMQYDAVGLGNHEFDWGIELTTDEDGTMPDYTIDDESFENNIPILCSNLYYAGTSKRVNFTKDYVILHKTATATDGSTIPVNVAVIGYIPDYSSSIMATRINPYTIKTGLSTVENTARNLKSSGQADAVVLLVHEDGEEIASKLSSSTPIDLVCGGHSHYGQTGTSRAPYIQSSAKAQGYASASLQFTADKNVSVNSLKYTGITGSSSALHDTPANAAGFSREVLSISHDAVEGVQDALTHELGYITTAVTGDRIGANPMSSTGGNWMTDLANRATGSKVSFTNSGGIRTNLYLSGGKHTVTVGDIYTIAPFGNLLYVYEVYYSDLLDILNWAIGRGKGLGLRMSGIDCYYSGSTVTALVEDGVCIYKDGKWAEGMANRRLRISANEFIATSDGTPFFDMAEIDKSQVDNEAFVRVLEVEKEQDGGHLFVDKNAHLIKGTYKGDLPENIYTITTSCSAGGSITPSAQVTEGASFTVTVTPDAGYHVSEFTVDGVARALPESLTYTLSSVGRDHTVYAGFEPDVVTDPCEGYTDINRGAWYHTAADFVIDAGIMGSTRTDALTFEPGAACTRAMIVSILYRLQGSPAVSYTAEFQDVKEGRWFAKAIMWAYQNGVVSGYGNGKFGPNDKVTREQMTMILMAYTKRVLHRSTDERASIEEFPDQSKVTWSRDAVCWAVALGIISGKATANGTILAPQATATRAEVASIFMRFLAMK